MSYINSLNQTSQPAIICSKLIETLEQGAKCVKCVKCQLGKNLLGIAYAQMKTEIHSPNILDQVRSQTK